MTQRLGKNTKGTQPGWSARAALQRADIILASPPAACHIDRVAARGLLAVRFALPLELLQPQNRTRHAPPWQLGRTKRALYAMMRLQLGGRSRPDPLPGRPLVRCVRFSSVEPDAYSDGFKAAIDILCERTTRARMRLNLIQDDRPACARIVQWWEPAPPGHGFGLVEVWTGA